jgi:hypothetical protein
VGMAKALSKVDRRTLIALKAAYTSSLRPHALIALKAAYTSSLRPHTLVA